MKIMYLICLILFLSPFTHALETQTISVNKGQTKRITLESNPSTGYSWALTKTVKKHDPIVITKSGYIPEQTDRVGAGGMQFWDIKARMPGKTELLFEYKRPWEKNTAPVKTKEVIIYVK